MTHINTEDYLRAKQIWEVLKELSVANQSEPIVVEGKRDKEALRRLGFEGEIILLNSGKGYYEFCEGLKDRYDSVILLIDWDSKGTEIYRKLAGQLPQSAYAFLRQRLIFLCQKDIFDVQSIPSLLNRLLGLDVRVGDGFEDFEEALRAGV